MLTELHAARGGSAPAAAPAAAAAPRVPLRIGGLTLEESGVAARPPSGAVVHLHDTLAVRPVQPRCVRCTPANTDPTHFSLWTTLS